jgi:hypothetical protein|tara:strand:- start:396 stop:641 length:246 start_codon:yes stop_codon:yes gene_type:complete
MSGKQSKKLRRKAETMLIDWLRTMTPDGEDQTKINKNNLHDFLPDQTHIFANNKFMLSAYSLRWFYKQVKRNPNITLQDIL